MRTQIYILAGIKYMRLFMIFLFACWSVFSEVVYESRIWENNEDV